MITAKKVADIGDEVESAEASLRKFLDRSKRSSTSRQQFSNYIMFLEYA